MPVNTPHPQYTDKAPVWRRLRDVIKGQAAVKRAGVLYLPKLHEQTDDEYRAMQGRALFFNATARTSSALVGMVFRKPAVIEGVAGLDRFMENATGQGITFLKYAEKVGREVLEIGRCGTLIDWAAMGEGNAGEARAVFYCAEDIINWRTAYIEGRQVLTVLVLREFVEDDTKDEFSPTVREVFRVYRRRNATKEKKSGVTVEVWSAEQAGEEMKLTRARAEVANRTGTVTEIPFQFHGPQVNSADVEEPPLGDLADVNLSHYLTSCDLENGRHFVGLPTPFAIGFGMKKTEPVHIGSTRVWHTETVGAECGFLEFTGQGLGALEKAIIEKEGQMKSLGARMLDKSNSKEEAYETVELRATGDAATLYSLASALSQSMAGVLSWVVVWNGTALEKAKGPKVTINSDFVAPGMTPQQITALAGLWVQGGISHETLFHNLEQGEVIPPGRTFEQEKEAIAAAGLEEDAQAMDNQVTLAKEMAKVPAPPMKGGKGAPSKK